MNFDKTKKCLGTPDSHQCTTGNWRGSTVSTIPVCCVQCVCKWLCIWVNVLLWTAQSFHISLTQMKGALLLSNYGSDFNLIWGWFEFSWLSISSDWKKRKKQKQKKQHTLIQIKGFRTNNYIYFIHHGRSGSEGKTTHGGRADQGLHRNIPMAD